MAQLIASNKRTVVVGLGLTGFSLARHLARLNEPFVLVDTREEPPGLAVFQKAFPGVAVYAGSNQEVAAVLASASRIVLSPGVTADELGLGEQTLAEIEILGDIELFAQSACAPVVAITGSNGKSTVTTLLAEMAKAAGIKVAAGGNLGPPALDLLADEVELYVLELSSFQLESTHNLHAKVAAVLNISPDHMDRYDSLMAYHQAKHRIFRGAEQVVVNRDDKLSEPLLPNRVKRWTFGLGGADFKGFGLVQDADKPGSKPCEPWLAFESKALMSVEELGIKGRHNVANALAALALGHAAGLPMEAMLSVLRTFTGLPHRSQVVAEIDGITWIDDSKATNVGAAIAAVQSCAEEFSGLVLIAGGQGKGQDFSPLAEQLVDKVKRIILIGEDAALIERALVQVSANTELDGEVPEVIHAASLEAAVDLARRLAEKGDCVLLSPACASFDMFSGYEERGRSFARAVEALQ